MRSQLSPAAMETKTKRSLRKARTGAISRNKPAIFWGFTPKMLRELDARFAAFLDGAIASNPLKGEYFLPSVVNDQLQAGIATVRVLPCEETWYGVTYREDLESVKAAIADMKKKGIYEENLWN